LLRIVQAPAVQTAAWRDITHIPQTGWVISPHLRASAAIAQYLRKQGLQAADLRLLIHWNDVVFGLDFSLRKKRHKKRNGPHFAYGFRIRK
jgi:hypothetical protein